MSLHDAGSTERAPRPPRSRSGCLTCRRRKCTWRPNVRSVQTPANEPSQAVQPASIQANDSLLDTWDFNDIIWNGTSIFDQSATGWVSGDGSLDLNHTLGDRPAGGSTVDGVPSILNTPGSFWRPFSDRPLPDLSSPASSADAGNQALVEHFLASEVPPILASVEIGPRWASTKLLLAALAGASNMVRYAMMAFSALRVGTAEDPARKEHRTLYDKASRLLMKHVSQSHQASETMASELRDALTTTFFLAYSDLLTNRVSEAQSLLRDAASLVRHHGNRKFSAVEKRLIAWVRLVDGRASSAGGEGAFLAETDSTTYTAQQTPQSGSDSAPPGNDVDAVIDEVLFDVLYTPGLVFYQKVQSIMARVSNIDPWHRSRGTVADETEVMAIGSAILKDLQALELERPALMDYAVDGSLTERHLAKDIAAAITRSYRTYWANYEAGFIHLHRVAHKHLPATDEVLRARSTIKRIARLFEDGGEPLPVNFIWPLLMACCEEHALEDRAWMIQSIRGMQSTASNAKPIADVLEEVHRRQDSSKQRADVRQTSMDLFGLSFAVV